MLVSSRSASAWGSVSAAGTGLTPRVASEPAGMLAVGGPPARPGAGPGAEIAAHRKRRARPDSGQQSLRRAAALRRSALGPVAREKLSTQQGTLPAAWDRRRSARGRTPAPARRRRGPPRGPGRRLPERRARPRQSCPGGGPPATSAPPVTPGPRRRRAPAGRRSGVRSTTSGAPSPVTSVESDSTAPFGTPARHARRSTMRRSASESTGVPRSRRRTARASIAASCSGQQPRDVEDEDRPAAAEDGHPGQARRPGPAGARAP